MSSSKLNSEISLGFIGLGSMGLPIAANLLRSGLNLFVHTRSRTAEKDKRLKGIKACSSPMSVSKSCNVLFICVSDDQAVENVLFGTHGAEEGLNQGDVVIDLSTISPNKARTFANKLTERKITYIDAPVSGGTEGAKEANLTIFLGCNHAIASYIDPIIKLIATNIYIFGAVGKGQEVKLINQILVAGSYAAVAEAIALGQTLDLPMDMVVEALKKGAASSWALTNRSKAMLEDRYPLGFKLGLHHKDLCIALDTAAETGVNLPITFKVMELEEELIKEGFKDEDISILRRSIK